MFIVRLCSIQETASLSVNSQIHIEKYRPFLISETNGYMCYTSGIWELFLYLIANREVCLYNSDFQEMDAEEIISKLF